MDKNSLRRIIEDNLVNLEGNAFQDFCDRLGLTLYPDDYTPVRAAGNQGDMKNDGYCPKARIFFAAHATRREQISATKDKIKSDLEGCLANHNDIKQWVYLTNDTLAGAVQTFVDEDLRPAHQDLIIETWDHKKIASTIYQLPISQIEYILGITLTSLAGKENTPVVDITDISPSGGSEGHFERFSIKNIGDEAAIDCRLSIVGDGYEWLAQEPRLPKTLTPGETLTEIKYKISDERLFKEEIADLKAVLEYENKRGVTVVTSRDLWQEKVPSGEFYNLKKAKFYPPTAIEPNPNPTPPAPTERSLRETDTPIIKEDDYIAEIKDLKAKQNADMQSFNVRLGGNSSAMQRAGMAINARYQPEFARLTRLKLASDRLYDIEVKEINMNFDEQVEAKNNEHNARGTYHSGFRAKDIGTIETRRDMELEKLKIKYGKP